MRIAIDISQIVHGTGVSFYTRNLVKTLAKIDKKNDYLLFGHSFRLKKVLSEFVKEVKKINKKFDAKLITLPPTFSEPLGNRLRFWPVEKITGPIDVYHSSDWVQFPSKAAKVTTIHDFGFFKYPNTAHPKIVSVMKRRLALVKKEVDLVIAVSQATAKDVVEYLNISKDKIKVIYEASAEEHQKTSLQIVEKTKKRLGIEGDYLLSVANLDPRKNLNRIIKSHSILVSQSLNIQLVIVGKFGWEEMKTSNVKRQKSKVIFPGYVTSQELSALYTGAKCLVYPSLYEGFGLPILEAMACGCPVVTANISSMPEVAGKAGVLVDPSKPKAIAQGINKAMTDRNRLIEAGLKQAKKFSWEKTARETLKAYEEAFKKNGFKQI